MSKLIKFLVSSAIGIALATSAFAAPVLKENIIVNTPIVTVGDMFDDAGISAEQALFRAPAPGTTGQVSLQSIRLATSKIGLDSFENPGFLSVNVSRAGVAIELSDMEALIAAELRNRNVLQNGVNMSATLTRQPGALFAENSATPLTLASLRFVPASNQFSARFELAGQRRPIDISGQLNFSIQTPHLIRALPVGTVLSADDIEMRPQPLEFAENAGVPMLEQLIGRQLVRNQLAGATLRLADVEDPTLIARNQIVTIYLKSGAMTLTVKGQALNDAAQGEPVSVLNLLSNKIVQGTADSAGTVRISSNSTRVAAL